MYPKVRIPESNNNEDNTVTTFKESLLIFLFFVLSFGRSNVKDFSFDDSSSICLPLNLNSILLVEIRSKTLLISSFVIFSFLVVLFRMLLTDEIRLSSS